MRTTELAAKRNYALATLAILAFLAGSPVWAQDEDSSENADVVVVPGDSESADAVPAKETPQPATVNSTSMSLGALPAASQRAVAPQHTVAAQQLKVPAAALEPSPSDISMQSSDALSGFGPSSGTVVGNRGLELRDEVLRLRSSVNLSANEFSLQRANGAAGAVQYHSTVAAITARLQNGTTRGNPILLRQWDEAEASLNEVTNSLNRLNALQTSVAADSSLAAYLLESVQAAFQLSGAVDEDHDQLKLLRDETSRMIVQLDYLRNQVADDIQRQTNYLTTERENLQSLAYAISRGELLGGNFSSRTVIVNPSPVAMMPQAPAPVLQAPAPQAAPPLPVTPGKLGPAPKGPRQLMGEATQLDGTPAALPAGDVGVAPTTGRLLVLIRYNQAVVDYEQQLSHAVSTVLQREPNAEFSIVAVTPVHGDPSDLASQQEAVGRNADAVKSSMVQLGLAPARISMGSTQLEKAQTAEVHVYVR